MSGNKSVSSCPLSSLIMVACEATLPGRRLAVTEPVSVVLPTLTAVRAVPLRAAVPPAEMAASMNHQRLRCQSCWCCWRVYQ